LMVAACLSVTGIFPSPTAALASQIMVGAVCYAIAVLALWAASGLPTGPERDLLQMASDNARRLWVSKAIGSKYRD